MSLINGHGQPEMKQSTSFPDGHRHLVPGEVLAAGDLWRDCMEKYTAWLPVPAARLGSVLGKERIMYIRPRTGAPIPMQLIHAYMGRQIGFTIENCFQIEAMVTDMLTRRRCRICGAVGEIDEGAMAAMEDAGDEIEKPPREYRHTADCVAAYMMRELMSLEQVYSAYLETNGVNAVEAAYKLDKLLEDDACGQPPGHDWFAPGV